MAEVRLNSEHHHTEDCAVVRFGRREPCTCKSPAGSESPDELTEAERELAHAQHADSTEDT